MRGLIGLLLSSQAFACSCFNSANACTEASGSLVVFVGKVLTEAAKWPGSHPARIAVEEPLVNISKDLREVDVDTMSGTSCERRLAAGVRYIVYATQGSKGPAGLQIAPCSNTMALEGNEYLLDAVRNQVRGGESWLVGRIWKSRGGYNPCEPLSGARVTVGNHEAVSDGFGRYRITGLSPGRHTVHVEREGFLPDMERNKSSSVRIVPLPSDAEAATETQPDGASIRIAPNQCEVLDLWLWADGAIRGTIRDHTGNPLPGIEVQAFQIESTGKRNPSPLRTAKANADGTYAIGPLPAGEYEIGINADKYRDASPYPPTVYGDSSGPKRLRLAEGGQLTGVDLLLPPPRAAVEVRVQVLSDGRPLRKANIRVDSPAGQQRGFHREATGDDGWARITLYAGERYTLRAFGHAGGKRLEGQSGLAVNPDTATIVIHLHLEPERATR